MNREEDPKLWDLLGRAQKVEPSPFFARNVVRAVRLRQPEKPQWIGRLNHRRFGANLDIGHSQVLGEDIPECVRLLGKRIWNLHVEDIPGRKHYHMIPGQGTLDWPGLKRALLEIGYARFLTVELYTHWQNPQEAAEQSYQFLSRIFG